MGLTAVVTGAGGAAGVAVIRALRALGHQTVGADSDASAAGLALADASALIPAGEDPDLVDVLCDVALRTGATAVVSTVAEELAALAGGDRALDGAGLAHWVPTAEAVGVCCDKWRFAALCSSAAVPAPPTALGTPGDLPGPWIVKPRFGRGSRHVYEVEAHENFDWVMRRVPDPIWQTRLSGREFTVDALVARDGSLAGAVPRWRLQVKAGISTKGCTFADAVLVDQVEHLLAAVGLQGAANVQGFVTEDGRGVFTEVNPRFSGGLPLSLAAGADLVGEYMQGLLGQPVRPERLAFRPGVSMTRYLDEVIIGAEGGSP